MQRYPWDGANLPHHILGRSVIRPASARDFRISIFLLCFAECSSRDMRPLIRLSMTQTSVFTMVSWYIRRGVIACDQRVVRPFQST